MAPHASTPFTSLPLPQGLLAWAKTQGPDMWHEIACGADFADPQATIDLLMTAQWILRQPDCCRATALLFLARMIQAGLHEAAPPQMAPEAARLVVRELHRRLAEGRFERAFFRLSPGQKALVHAYTDADHAHALPPAVQANGRHTAHPPHAFLGWRPVAINPALRPALHPVMRLVA